VERQSASACLTWDITWTLCNACNPTFIDRSSVPHAHVECASGIGHIRQKYPFEIDCKFFSEGRCFYDLAWYCVYRVPLLCDKFWACLDLKSKVAVVENAKKCCILRIMIAVTGNNWSSHFCVACWNAAERNRMFSPHVHRRTCLSVWCALFAQPTKSSI